MSISRIRAVGLLLAAGLGLSACVSDGYYGGVSAGYGGYGGYYDDPYYDGYGDYYGSYGYGYPSSYYGWYGDYYYPGTGVYVYDRYRRPHRWNDSQRRYWSQRADRYRRDHRDWNGDRNGNWGGWNRGDRGDRDHDWNRGDRGDRDHNWNRGDRGDRTHNWNRGDRTPAVTRVPRATTPRVARPRVSGQRGTTRSPAANWGNRGDRGTHHRR